MNKRLIALFAPCLCLATAAFTAEPLPPVEPKVIPLWRDGSPNNPQDGPRPTLEIYRAFPPARSVDVTLVITPGGGYGQLSPFERLYAEYFRALGFSCVVVNYRVAPNRYPAEYADAVRAMRLVRQNAKEWGLPSEKIALLGGSAGGHLAAVVTTQPDYYHDPEDDLAGKVSARPGRLVLLYPVISAVAPYRHRSFKNFFGDGEVPEPLREAMSPERNVTKDCPPVLIFHAADDTNVILQNSIDFARACSSAGVDAELQIYPHGGHGYSFAYDADNSPRWRARVAEWLKAWK